MKIGILGSRGIPNRYGGFEQFASFAAPELVKRGHEVIVYNSSLHPYPEDSWKGVQLVKCFDPENRLGAAGQFIYDLNCIIDARKRNFDVLLQLGYTSSSIWSSLLPKKTVVITNMDGLEWKRQKYSRLVRRFMKKAEKWAVNSSQYLIADSEGIQEYLEKKYGRRPAFIAYGADMVDCADPVLLPQELKPFQYDLLIARMEPENNIETIIRGHLASGIHRPLLVVGGNGNKHGTGLKKKYQSHKVRFLESVYDPALLNSLRFHSCIYFHGHSAGGTNPSLLEAMASRCLLMAHDNIFNRSVLGEDAFYFDAADDIAKKLAAGLDRRAQGCMGCNNAKKITTQYSWPHIINLLENLLLHALEESGRKRK